MCLWLVIIVEMEIWFNFYFVCYCCGILLMIVNVWLLECLLCGYCFVCGLVWVVLCCVSLVLV